MVNIHFQIWLLNFADFLTLTISIYAIITIAQISDCSSTYDDICTIVDRMIAEDWMGVAASLGRDIKAMLAPSGIDASNPCPQPPRSLNITDGVIHLPEIPSGLTMFADVCHSFNLLG